MITHYAVMTAILRIARIAVADMMYLDALAVLRHHQQHGDGSFATGTGVQISDAEVLVLLQSFDKLQYTARLDGFARGSIHLLRILVRRIVREVTADYEEILLVEVRQQRFGYLLQFLPVLRSDDDGHDGRHLLETIL